MRSKNIFSALASLLLVATASPASAAPAESVIPPVLSIFSSNDIDVKGDFEDRWKNDGKSRSSYGKPTADEVCGENDICYQTFEHGVLVRSPENGTHLLSGKIGEAWIKDGADKSHFGVPTAEETRTDSGGVEQLFSKGSRKGGLYLASEDADAQYVNLNGSIGKFWVKDGGYQQDDQYGMPTGAETCGFINKSCYQDFEHATIVWSPKTGAVRVHGVARDLWKSKGGMKSDFGIPVGPEKFVPDGSATVQEFAKDEKTGAIYLTTENNEAHYVNYSDDIGALWINNGGYWEDGTDTPKRYGYPTSDEVCKNNSYCYQKFQYGIVTWDKEHGAGGSEAQKCMVLNDGRSKYSAEGAHRVALALAPAYSKERYDPVGSHGTFYSCRNVFGMYIQDWKTPTAFGENGFLAPDKQIKDYESGELLPAGVTGNTASAYNPTGSFSLSDAFGEGDPGAGFSKYQLIKWNSRWGGDANSDHYNKYVEDYRLGYPNEDMKYFLERGDYRQGLMINYNRKMDGSVPSGTAGFAIMLHTLPIENHGFPSTIETYQSWGCVVIDYDHMIQFLQEGTDGDRIFMGVESEVIKK